MRKWKRTYARETHLHSQSGLAYTSITEDGYPPTIHSAGVASRRWVGLGERGAYLERAETRVQSMQV